VEELVDRIQRHGVPIESDLDTLSDCRDPKDNYILAIALSGKAEFLLSEDEDLLVLNPWRGIHIARLFQFVQDYPLTES
jgi:putative PIN family toxin of toxin-antitoxin system